MKVSKLGLVAAPFFALMVGTSYAGIVPSQFEAAAAPSFAIEEAIVLAATDRDAVRERRRERNDERRERRRERNNPDDMGMIDAPGIGAEGVIVLAATDRDAVRERRRERNDARRERRRDRRDGGGIDLP